MSRTAPAGIWPGGIPDRAWAMWDKATGSVVPANGGHDTPIIDVQRDFGAQGNSTDDTAAFYNAIQYIIDNRVADASYGAGGHRCPAKLYVPGGRYGRYLITQPEVLMRDLPDPNGEGTVGLEIFGDGAMTDIVYSGTGPLFHNYNDFLFPVVRDMRITGGGNGSVLCKSDSGGVAQGWGWLNLHIWGTWGDVWEQDTYVVRTVGALTGVTNGTPSSFTIPNHGLSVGQWIKITGTVGVSGLTVGQGYMVATVVDANTVKLTNQAGGIANINTTGVFTGPATVLQIQSNGNDSWLWQNVKTPCNPSGWLFNCGLTPNYTQQDQSVAHAAYGCNFDLRDGGGFNFQHGGSFTHVGGSAILQDGGHGGKAMYALGKNDVAPHLPGAPMLDVEGVRYEIRDPNGMLISSQWDYGTITFKSIDSNWPFTNPSQIMADFDSSGNIGPSVSFENSQLSGRHRYGFRANDWQAGVKRAFYDSRCYITMHDDPQDFIVHNDLSGTGAIGLRWWVQSDARGAAAFNSGAQLGRRFECAPGAYSVLGAGLRRLRAQICNSFGTLPNNTAPASIVLPLNSRILSMRLVYAGTGGDTTTGITYTVKDGLGNTIFTFTVPGAWNAGADSGDVAISPTYFLGSDAARTVTVSTTATLFSAAGGHVEIEYQEGY